MTVARVEWTRLEGDDVEAVVGMFICSDFPNAVRVRPSQGDGGVDIFVPGPEGFAKQRVVYQVKKYFKNLTSRQKREITRSFNTVIEASKDEGWELSEWHLVMPLDLTDHNLAQWLKDLTEGAEFPCETHGLLYCDTKAAQYPKIIDYYLRDGKDRLQAAVGDLAAIIANRTREADRPLAATDVVSDLTAIYRALNDHDPFYRYEVALSDSPPPTESPNEPGLVGVHAMERDSVWITIKIFALSRASLEERPIGGQFQIVVPSNDDELRGQVQRHIDYGAPLTMPPGSVTGSLDLPGGLGGELQEGSVQILEAPDDEQTDPAELLLAVVEPDSDTVVASTTIRRIAVSSGQVGMRSVFTDQANLFALEMLMAAGGRTGRMALTVEYDLAGRRPAELVDSLNVLSAWRAPNRLAFALTYGPRDYGVVATIDTDRDGDSALWARVCEALAGIQDHVPTLLRMPDEMSRDEASGILAAAKLVSGQTVTGSVLGQFTVHHQADAPEIVRELDRLYEFVTFKDIEISLADEAITVGKQAVLFLGRYAEVTQDYSKIEPLGNYVGMRYDGSMEVTRVLARPARSPSPVAEPALDEDAGLD